MAEFLTHHRKKLFIVFLISVLLMVGLCAQLGWTLALEPNPGGGTLARVQIPAEENAEAALPGRVELCAEGERKNTRLRWLLTRECYLLEGTNA